MDYFDEVERIANHLADQFTFSPELGIVLGSGLGDFADLLTNRIAIDYDTIPEFPTSTVEGHAGRFILGELAGKKLLLMQGRFHFYEGYTMQQVTLPIRVMHRLGIKRLILSNASGGVNPAFRAGDIMLISDHINQMPNPLLGPNESRWGTRFPSMHDAYSASLRQKALACAEKLGDRIVEGCYLGTTGPSFETPHEYEYFRSIGADAVGMSTVPEVIVARHCGIEVAAFSLITNVGGLHLTAPVSHEEVQAAGEQAKHRFGNLLKELIAAI